MLTAAFVSVMLGYAVHAGCIPVANSWMNRCNRPAPHIPLNSNCDKENAEQFVPQWTQGHTPGKKLLRMDLLAAITRSDGTPELSLASNRALKRELCKHCGTSGFLITGAIKPSDISRLKTFLQASQCNLLLQGDHFELTIDSGFSKIVSPSLKFFISGSLQNISIPFAMEGIYGQFIAKQKGTIQYKVINDQGGISMLQCEGYYLPGLMIRMFSPQTFLQEHKTGQYYLEWDKSIFGIPNCNTITIGYHQHTSLPILRGFNDTMKTAKSLALYGLTDDSNQNLMSQQKRLFTWHTRWGHLGFQPAQ